MKKNEATKEIQVEAGQNILCTFSLGYEGILRLMDIKKDALQERFISTFFDDFREETISSILKASIACSNEQGTQLMMPLGTGGIFAGLYELGERCKMGMSISMKALPLMQETIECCEFLDVNPYQLSSKGCLLIVTREGNSLCKKLKEKGIPAVLIGVVTDSNDRICYRNEERRYLNKGVEEELLRFMK